MFFFCVRLLYILQCGNIVVAVQYYLILKFIKIQNHKT
jgi:hypothetical protein